MVSSSTEESPILIGKADPGVPEGTLLVWEKYEPGACILCKQKSGNVIWKGLRKKGTYGLVPCTKFMIPRNFELGCMSVKKLMQDSDHWPTLVPNTVIVGKAMAKWKAFCKGPGSNIDGLYGQLPLKDWYQAMGEKQIEKQDNEIDEMLDFKAPGGEVFWRWKIKPGVQCYPSNQEFLVTGNYTWAGVWWTMLKNGTTRLPVLAAETAVIMVKTMFDKTFFTYDFHAVGNCSIHSVPPLGMVLMGMIAKAILRV